MKKIYSFYYVAEMRIYTKPQIQIQNCSFKIFINFIQTDRSTDEKADGL